MLTQHFFKKRFIPVIGDFSDSSISRITKAYRSTNLGSFMLLSKNAQFGIKIALKIIKVCPRENQAKSKKMAQVKSQVLMKLCLKIDYSKLCMVTFLMIIAQCACANGALFCFGQKIAQKSRNLGYFRQNVVSTS